MLSEQIWNSGSRGAFPWSSTTKEQRLFCLYHRNRKIGLSMKIGQIIYLCRVANKPQNLAKLCDFTLDMQSYRDQVLF